MKPPTPENIHPIFEQLLGRPDKEKLLRQSGQVIWIYGLSGSGKSTLANGLERRLHQDKIMTQLLDGDNIRTGLNKNLGFSDADREENIRRIAEVARLFLQAGVVTLASFITPRRNLREMARQIVGPEDFIEVYIECRFETCEARDVKGLYARARSGNVAQFTGRDSCFEPPAAGVPNLVINTDRENPAESLDKLYASVKPLVMHS